MTLELSKVLAARARIDADWIMLMASACDVPWQEALTEFVGVYSDAVRAKLASADLAHLPRE